MPKVAQIGDQQVSGQYKEPSIFEEVIGREYYCDQG